MIPGGGGALVKMIIVPFSKKERRIPSGLPLEVMYNPNKFQTKYQVEFCHRPELGSPSQETIFKRVVPQDYDFEFVFDNTGASPSAGMGQVANIIPVQIQVERFFNVVGFNGDIHRPNYLKLIWGITLVKNVVLETADIEYTLFSAVGVPLRAKIRARFTENDPDDIIQRLLNLRSPDLSHKREVEEENKIDQLTYDVYDNPTYYIEIARHNGLKNFRRLKPGTKLDFPPLRDRTE